MISQAPESVLEIELGSDPGRAAVISWQIGNLHFPVEITDQIIRCVDDPAIRLLLSREGVPWRPTMRGFSPNHLSRTCASSLSKPRRWLPALLQISDAAFPTGSYAHSFGLEEMVRQGQVHDEASLRAFLHEHVIPGLTHVDLPLVRESRAAAMAGNHADLIAVDELAAALRVPRELREASLQTGRRRLAILIRLRATPELELLHAISAKTRWLVIMLLSGVFPA